MTTPPTTDADRLQAIRDILRGWAEYDTLTDAEALAKVRALLSEGEPASKRLHALAVTMRAKADAEERAPQQWGHAPGVSPDLVIDWADEIDAIPRGEPAKVRDSLTRIALRLEEIAAHGGDVTLDDGGPGILALAGQLHDLAGYAPQGAPPEARGSSVRKGETTITSAIAGSFDTDARGRS